jgi:hypothetical protein
MADPLAAPATPGVADRRAVEEAVRLADDLIKLDTTNHGGGYGREREAAEDVAECLAEAGLKPGLLEAAPRRSAHQPARRARRTSDRGAQALAIPLALSAPPVPASAAWPAETLRR